MNIIFPDISTCVLIDNGKTILCQNLKKEKYPIYSLEKANIEIKDKIIDDDSKLSYIKGLIKKTTNKKVIVIDDLSKVFNYEERLKIFKYLDNQGIQVIYLTNDVEDLVNFPYTIVIRKQKIALEGKTNLILKEEKLMKVLGYSLPFYVNLSTQLMYYGVLNKICYTKEELEAQIWK